MTALELLPSIVSCSSLLLGYFCVRRLRTGSAEQQSRATKRIQALQCELGELRSAMQELRARLEEAERTAGTLVPPPQPRSGINFSSRIEAIRLFRRGEQPAQVAAALAVPAGEAELLFKVQKVLAAGEPFTEDERPARGDGRGRRPARG